MKRIRSRAGKRQQTRIGAPDRSLTANAGLAAVTELCDGLRVIEALDAAVGPVKQRDRGFGAGELLTGIAAAQQVSADPRSRRRRTLHPDQRDMLFPDLARQPAVYACSFILTNLDVTAPDKGAAVEHWYRHRTTVETCKPQCCHRRRLSALSLVPSGSVFMLAA